MLGLTVAFGLILLVNPLEARNIVRRQSNFWLNSNNNGNWGVWPSPNADLVFPADIENNNRPWETNSPPINNNNRPWENNTPTNNNNNNNNNNNEQPNWEIEQPVESTSENNVDTTTIGMANTLALHTPPEGCQCVRTFEFNPICGTDNNTYANASLMRCFQQCGTNVSLRHNGSCRRSG